MRAAAPQAASELGDRPDPGRLIAAVLSVYAFTKSLPWADPYTVKAVFANAGNIRPNSPVRIAGVNVGKVTGDRAPHAGDAAEVTAQAEPDEDAPRRGAAVDARPW